MKNSAASKVRQVAGQCLLVGVDPHKRTHMAVAVTRDYRTHSRLKFSNTREGFEKVVQWAGYEMVKNNCKEMMFAIETASHYWRNLAYYLADRGISFRQVNQFTLKRRREGKDNNKRKSDFRDAEVAAQLLCSGEFTDGKLPTGVYAELRAAYGAYRRLCDERNSLVNRLKGLLDGLFPEFTQVFKDVRTQTSLSVLEICPNPGCIAAMAADEFVGIIRARHQGRLMKKKLVELHAVSPNSAGIKEGATSVSLELSLLAGQERLLQSQVRTWEVILKQLVTRIEESPHLLSIKGLNSISVAGWLAQTGPFGNYHCAKQMIKLAGSNPILSESAGKSRSRTPMSKKGRAQFRNCLWVGIIPVIRHNQEFRSWLKPRLERPANANPLHRREVIGAALNRIIRIGFALVRDRCFYHAVEPVFAAG